MKGMCGCVTLPPMVLTANLVFSWCNRQNGYEKVPITIPMGRWTEERTFGRSWRTKNPKGGQGRRMEFLKDYEPLEAGQRDRFQQVVTRLLSGQVIPPGSPLKPDLDWKFADRYRELIDSYLRMGG